MLNVKNLPVFCMWMITITWRGPKMKSLISIFQQGLIMYSMVDIEKEHGVRKLVELHLAVLDNFLQFCLIQSNKSFKHPFYLSMIRVVFFFSKNRSICQRSFKISIYYILFRFQCMTYQFACQTTGFC